MGVFPPFVTKHGQTMWRAWQHPLFRPRCQPPTCQPCGRVRGPRLLASLARYATLPYQRIGFPLSPSTWVLGDARDPMRARRRTHQPPRPRLTPSVEITQSCRRSMFVRVRGRGDSRIGDPNPCVLPPPTPTPPRAREPPMIRW
jgi:hypothetical protein